MTTTITPPSTHELAVTGATLVYDVRPVADSEHRTLLLIGSPMDAAGFVTLADHFGDRTVVTYDPRGTARSAKEDVNGPVDPDVHAADLSRVISALGIGAVDLFASSGGAVNALALVAKHPEQVRTLVAHEPPLAAIVSDSDEALAACRAVADTYQQSGFGAGMAHFITVVSHDGPFTDEFLSTPPPDPAIFGMPTDDDGSRSDPLLGQNMVTCTHYLPDFDALAAASTRIVLAAGSGSGEQLASRGARAAAAKLGLEPVMFPGDHGGFLGGECGQTGEPDAFAARLREVLLDSH